jgi:trimeric autotransporter adhesin
MARSTRSPPLRTARSSPAAISPRSDPNGAAFPTTRTRLALINSDGALNPGFNPGPTGAVYAVQALSDGSILAGGLFSGFKPTVACLSAATSPISAVPQRQSRLPRRRRKRLAFLHAQSQRARRRARATGGYAPDRRRQLHEHRRPARARLARLTLAGVIDTTFNPGVDGLVSTLSPCRSTAAFCSAALSPTSPAPPAPTSLVSRRPVRSTPRYAPATNGSVFAVRLLPDGKILIAGSFTAVSGRPRNRLARLNADGSLDAAFTTSVGDGEVRSLALSVDGKITLGGTFTTVVRCRSRQRRPPQRRRLARRRL